MPRETFTDEVAGTSSASASWRRQRRGYAQVKRYRPARGCGPSPLRGVRPATGARFPARAACSPNVHGNSANADRARACRRPPAPCAPAAGFASEASTLAMAAGLRVGVVDSDRPRRGASPPRACGRAARRQGRTASADVPRAAATAAPRARCRNGPAEHGEMDCEFLVPTRRRTDARQVTLVSRATRAAAASIAKGHLRTGKGIRQTGTRGSAACRLPRRGRMPAKSSPFAAARPLDGGRNSECASHVRIARCRDRRISTRRASRPGRTCHLQDRSGGFLGSQDVRRKTRDCEVSRGPARGPALRRMAPSSPSRWLSACVIRDQRQLCAAAAARS